MATVNHKTVYRNVVEGNGEKKQNKGLANLGFENIFLFLSNFFSLYLKYMYEEPVFVLYCLYRL